MLCACQCRVNPSVAVVNQCVATTLLSRRRALHDTATLSSNTACETTFATFAFDLTRAQKRRLFFRWLPLQLLLFHRVCDTSIAGVVLPCETWKTAWCVFVCCRQGNCGILFLRPKTAAVVSVTDKCVQTFSPL